MPRFLFRPFAGFCLGVLAFTVPAAVAQTANYSVFASFTDNAAGGAEPLGNLVQAPDGNYYGESSYITNDIGTIEGVIYRVSPSGAITALYSPQTTNFTPGPISIGSDGYFYGVSSGGANGYGYIFKVSPSGAFTDLYDFQDSTDGGYPSGPLVQGSDGNFYGTASQGGNLNLCPNFLGTDSGCGTIFKLTPAGKFSVVYTFQDTTADYAGPNYGLVQGLDGNYYGVTVETVFQVTSAGGLKTIGVSNGTTDGIYFNGPLVEGSDGAFYGTAQYNGANAYGTVFKATTAGGISVVDALCGGSCPEGANPVAPLFEAGDGNFYGENFYGEVDQGPCADQGCGGVFQVTTAGKLTALYTGSDSNQNGLEFGTTPVQGSSGYIYGAAGHGGTGSDPDECGGDNCGLVFQAIITPTPALPVVLKASASTVTPNTSVTLSYTVNAANSLTQQQCYAFVQGGASGAGTWTGKQTGTYSSTTHAWTGSASVKPTADGTYTYALTCGGNVSGFATLTVAAAKASSSTALAISPSPDTVGVPLTFKATVTGSSGTPTGNVSFLADGFTLGTVALSSGVASLTFPSSGLPDGSYPVSASYAGSTTYNTSNSPTVNAVVNSAPTSTTLTANPNPLTPPAAITFTATVKRTASGATGTPTGSVGFYIGTSLLDTATLSNGVATYKLPSTNGLPQGSYTLTAKYEGDSTDVASSGNVSVTVK